jgi:hypothetical protein
LKVNRRFGEACHHHHQIGTISQERNICEALLSARLTLVSHFVFSLALMMETTCSSETPVNFNGLRGVISLKIELFTYYYKRPERDFM